MTAITSGSFREPMFSRAVNQLVTGLFGSVVRAIPERRSDRLLTRVREANAVRDLARSVELQSPGFASDLYAAAMRHEGLDD